MRIDAATLPSDPVWTADVAIVGSGASGAVWAERLSARGLDVLVLEEGGHFTARNFTQREDEMYPLLYRDSGSQLTEDGRISVLQGRCVGGSTVVNMADVERIPPEIFTYWRTLTGIAEFEEKTFVPFFERNEAAIGANTIDAATLNRNNDLLRRGTEKLGHRGGPMRHNRVNCTGSGYCLIGCAYDAKRSTLVTLIPQAEANGARIASGAQVERLIVEGGEIREVTGNRVDPRTKKTVGTFRVRAKTVVLAAGAVHTPLILLRSGLDQGPVGKNLSLQPQLPFMAIFADEVRPFRGIPQSYFHDEYEVHSKDQGLTGFRIEGISGGPGMSAQSLVAVGMRHKEEIAKLLRTAASLVLVPDEPGGEVRVGKGRNRADIRYALQPKWKANAQRGLQVATEVYFAAGAQQVVIPTIPALVLKDPAEFPAQIGFDVGSVSTISAHPQGTCRIGTDPRNSVVDPDGRHHHVRNLYVIDASLFPTTASTHTMIPIMATADWLAEKFQG